MVHSDRCIGTYPAVFINHLIDINMGCAMTKIIQNDQNPERYETMLYAVVVLSMTGIVIAAVLRSAVMI